MEIQIQSLRKQAKLFEYSDAGEYCKAIYESIRASKKSYSISDFSDLFGFGSNNTMAQIHSGHRKLSEKAGERIADILKLSRIEKNYFMSLVRIHHVATPEEQDRLLALVLELRARHSDSTNLSKSLEFFNSWLHSVVFELLYLEQPQSVEDICDRIMPEVKPSAVEKSVKFLHNIGVIEEKTESAGSAPKYVKLQKDFSLGSAVPGLAIVRYHQEMIKLAKDSLLTSPPSERDISSVTISVTPEQIDWVKSEIDRLRKYLLLISSESENNARVMQVNIQLFPLSK